MEFRLPQSGTACTGTSAENSLLDSLVFGHGRLRIIFVSDSEVIKNILALLVHAADSFADDDREFVGERGIVGFQVGDRIGEEMAVAVLMLEPLAGECRPSRRAADKEAFRLHIRRRPDEIAHAAGGRTSNNK